MAPRGWSNKDERKYDKIEKSQQKRGTSTRRAKEIAARTVNKGRRQEGRTPNNTTQGTGRPGSSLEERSKPEIYNMAADREIRGRSKMGKGDM